MKMQYYSTGAGSKNFTAKFLFAAMLIAFTALPFSKVSSNNLRITNIVTTQNASPGGTVQFDISWDNSWYITSAPANWDAVWVFVKFRDCAAASSVAYTHGNLSSAMSDHTLGSLQAMTTGDGNTPSALATASAPQGTTMDYSGATGIMLRRNAVTTGPVTTSQTNVILTLTNLPASATSLTVHIEGIEMVYCLPGDFYVGDGDGSGMNFSTQGSPYRFADGTSNFPSPMLVTSSTETALSTFYQMSSDGSPATPVSSVPIPFPKGQFGFYIMKYEINQGLYTEFLNTIGSAAAGAHYTTNMTSYRGTIVNNGNNIYTCSRSDRAMNQLGWDDFSAVLCWACLRPMTELEYEKACRGPLAAVTGEFAWGMNGSATNGNTFNFPPIEDGTETLTTGQANFGNVSFTNGDFNNGPLRNGIFATPASNRTTSGAGYYGAMELSGNVKEWVVTLHSTGGSNTFTRRWGTGTLVSNNHNIASWPAAGTSVSITGSNTRTIGHKGAGSDDTGASASSSSVMTTSSRLQIYNGIGSASVNYRGTYSFGGRGVR